MSVSSKADVAGHVNSRIDTERSAISSHVDTTANGVKRIVSGGRMAAQDLLSLKPVQAVTHFAEGVVEGVTQDIIGGNVKATLNNVRTQAEITRRGRI